MLQKNTDNNEGVVILKEPAYEQNSQYVLKGVWQYPFDDTFESFRKRYMPFIDLNKGKNWRNIIASLHICDQNERHDGNERSFFPVKSGDLVFAAFHAFREKSKSKSKITFHLNSAAEYNTFVTTFCQTIDQIKPQPHIEALLYSDERFQYINTNEVCLKPLIDKIALILSIIILDQSKERNTFISKTLEMLEEISAQYLLDKKTFRYNAETLRESCSLDKVIFDLCKILRRKNNEFSTLEDTEVKNKIQTYVSLYNHRLRNSKEAIKAEEEVARTAYLEYLNTHLVTEEQKRESEQYKEAIGLFDKDACEETYRKNLEDYLFRTKYTPTSIQMALNCRNWDPIQFSRVSEMDDYEKLIDLYQRLLKGPDAYFRKLIDETFNAYVKEAIQISENYSMMLYGMESIIQYPTEYNINQYLLNLGAVLEKRKTICVKLNIPNYVEIAKMDCNAFQKRFKSIVCTEFHFLVEEEDFVRIFEGMKLCYGLLQNRCKASEVSFERIQDLIKKLIYIVSLDNMVLHKLLANRHANTFMERRAQVKQEIAARIEQIRNDGEVYAEVSAGISNAVHELLFQLYKKP